MFGRASSFPRKNRGADPRRKRMFLWCLFLPSPIRQHEHTVGFLIFRHGFPPRRVSGPRPSATYKPVIYVPAGVPRQIRARSRRAHPWQMQHRCRQTLAAPSTERNSCRAGHHALEGICTTSGSRRRRRTCRGSPKATVVTLWAPGAKSKERLRDPATAIHGARASS